MTYRERREAKAERLREWADKREERAAADLERARTMAAAIPFGQPIHVGHHSERADRNYRARIGRTYDRAFESANKAENMRNRADGIEAQAERAIYSDDPDAIDRLRGRVAELEAERDRVKAYNASCRKGAPDPTLLDERQRADIAGTIRIGFAGRGGSFPAYHLSNLSGNIKRNRDRLAQLERQAERLERTEAAGGTLVEYRGDGRYAVVTFAEKPDRATLDALKAAGYRWARPSWIGEAARLPEGIAP